jgi:ABC-2 type transport system permease protein
MANLKRVYADFKVFSRGYTRNVIGLFFGLIFPVILILIFGAIFSGNNTGPVPVYVQNQDTDGSIALEFVSNINGTYSNGTKISDDWPLRTVLVDSSVDFVEYLSDHSSSDGIIIPQNFSSSYLAREKVAITVYGSPAASTSAIISGVVGSLANQYNLQRVGGSAIIELTSATVNAQQTKYIDFLIPGLIGFSILVNPMFAIVSISSDYKKTKLFKQLSLTPLTKTEWLTSKIMFYILLSSVSFLLMAGVGILAFDASITLTFWLIPFLVLGPLLFCSLGMLVGTVSKTPETASIVGNIITFPMMFLSGTFFPIAMMPDYLQTAAHVLPLFYVIEGLNNVMVYGNTSGVMVDLAVVAIIAVAIFIAAIKLFKWKED